MPNEARPKSDMRQRARGREAEPASPRRAVFLDRDGVINERAAPHCYVTSPEQVVILPYAAEGIRRLRAQGFLAIMVTNQAGVGRGIMQLAELEAVQVRVRDELGRGSAVLDAIYYCPHAPSDGCDCRKPKDGMLRRAASDLRVDLSQSFMVGDSLSDVQAGQRAGCATILVRCGGAPEDGGALVRAPDYIAADLREVADIVAEVGRAARHQHAPPTP